MPAILAHLGFLKNGKGPDCLPGTPCFEQNKNHWKTEIKAHIDKAQKYTKDLKGKTLEKTQKMIEALRNEAGL